MIANHDEASWARRSVLGTHRDSLVFARRGPSIKGFAWGRCSLSMMIGGLNRVRGKEIEEY